MAPTSNSNTFILSIIHQTTNLLNAPRNVHGKLLAGRPRSKCF